MALTKDTIKTIRTVATMLIHGDYAAIARSLNLDRSGVSLMFSSRNTTYYNQKIMDEALRIIEERKQLEKETVSKVEKLSAA